MSNALPLSGFTMSYFMSYWMKMQCAKLCATVLCFKVYCCDVNNTCRTGAEWAWARALVYSLLPHILPPRLGLWVQCFRLNGGRRQKDHLLLCGVPIWSQIRLQACPPPNCNLTKLPLMSAGDGLAPCFYYYRLSLWLPLSSRQFDQNSFTFSEFGVL